MHNHKKHLWIMLACCLVPLAGLAAISILRIPASNVLTLGMVLLCPALHLLMMKGMLGQHSHGETNSVKTTIDGHASESCHAAAEEPARPGLARVPEQP